MTSSKWRPGAGPNWLQDDKGRVIGYRTPSGEDFALPALPMADGVHDADEPLKALTPGAAALATNLPAVVAQTYQASAAARAAADRITSDRDSACFLQKATLGPTLAEIQGLTALGSKRAWILDQFTKKYPMRFVDYAYHVMGATNLNDFNYRNQTDTTILSMMLQGPAPLRSKCIHALNKLFVMSYGGGAFDDLGRIYSFVSWYDRMDKHVFGNWRDLIESITYSLHMSRMLTYYASEKAVNGNQPDENYAREIMQLFSIGLHELNIDGTLKLDGDGKPIPTYVNEDIRQVARCFTGLTQWNFNEASQRYEIDDANGRAAARIDYGVINGVGLFSDPHRRLRHYHPFYEFGAKKALNGRIDIPEGTDPVTNLNMVHDALFNHPNTPPFFAVRMIQHLVTSNPSPAYVARVAQAFIDNGDGVRGDLKAVWLAILTDPEAASDGRYAPDFGRVRDSFDMWCNFQRSLDRKNTDGRISIMRLGGDIQTWASHFGSTGPRIAPSIFGPYDPLHTPTELSVRGLLAPEAQMWSDVQIARTMNELINITITQEAQDSNDANGQRSDYSMLPLTGTPAELIERLNLLLCGGQMSPGLRTALLGLLTPMASGTTIQQNDRVAVAMQLIVSSPDFWTQL